MTDDQAEAREHRAAFCRCEGVSEEAIQAIFKSRPDLFGYDEKTEVQENLI